VAGLDWPAGTAIRVAQAIETESALFGGPWPAVALAQRDVLEAEILASGRATVEAAKLLIARPGLEVTTAVLAGRPASAMVDAARSLGVDLVVVGSRGHGTIESMVLGSVSSEIVDHASVPVLFARRQEVRRVILAWDGSASSRVAADLIRTWPIFNAAAIRVVSIAHAPFPWWTGIPGSDAPQLLPMYLEAAEASRRRHRQLAEEMAGALGASGLAATAEQREGDAADEILGAAVAFDADLIVLGTHGWTGLRRLVLGSVARNVLHHADASVLIARDAGGSSSTREG
jgi:nucleotide-binding universal stress UspA family protein